MNKILPIILVVVLSGCTAGNKDELYSCIHDEHGFPLFVRVTADNMFVERDNDSSKNIYKTDFYKDTSIQISKSYLIESYLVKDIITFDRIRKTLRHRHIDNTDNKKDITGTYSCEQ